MSGDTMDRVISETLARNCNHSGIRTSDFTKDGDCRDCIALRDALRGALGYCWKKFGWITADHYCGRHGRQSGWPCSVGSVTNGGTDK